MLVKETFEVQGGRGDLPPDSSVEKGFILPGGENLLDFIELHQVPLELRPGPQRPALVSSGKASLHASCERSLGIPLQSVSGPKTSCGDEVDPEDSSSFDMDLGVLLESAQRVSPRLEWGHARLLSSRAVAAGSVFLSR